MYPLQSNEPPVGGVQPSRNSPMCRPTPLTGIWGQSSCKRPRSACATNTGRRPADEDDRPRLVSGGHVARFQDDHRRLSRSLARIPVEPWIDRDPALPQPITLVSRGRARAYRARKLVGQSNHGVWMCL